MSKINRSQLTLVFKHTGKHYKFFWLSFDKKDHSIYFNCYPLKNADGKVKHKIITGKGKPVDWKSQLFEATETPFDSQKYSYHKSGMLHVKSRQGTPLESGYYFVPFDQIDNGVQFASILPSLPINYPEVSESELEAKNKSLIISTNEPKKSIAVYLFLLNKNDNNLPPSSLANYKDIECKSAEFPFRILVRVAPTDQNWNNNQVIVTQSINDTNGH